MAFAPPAHGRGTQQKQDDPEQRVDEREPRPAGEAASFRLALGDGAPVDPGVRGRAEAAWGTSLADVRVHTDAAGEAAASAAGAHAATVGGDVAFAPGRYRPGTLRGDALIAHELAHVVQQRGAGSTA